MHGHHAIGVSRDGGIVGDHDHRRITLARGGNQQRDDVLGGHRVQASGGLVGQNDRGFGHQGSRDRHPLLLAA